MMFYEGITSGCLELLLKEVHLYTRVWPGALAPCSPGVEAESNLFIFDFFRFSVSIFCFRNMFCNHDAVKVFVCLRSVLSLFLLDHLHQVDNYDDRTVFPLIIKRVIVPCLLKHVDGSATGKNSQLFLYLNLSALVVTSEILNFQNQFID